ncbi:hypothetical protein MANY_42170 [Mycolicibacterium anyangense]|uniref:Peptidase C39-like domain-containing protein n=2 Tax=Mycolicibacterium anyangense TaxID=1431246 RepID=A0A6N4WA21_9MYCO|nr:hypothetical protein MANY_42170 [Mycolicibacterium anyangense]
MWPRQRDGVTCGPSVAVMAGALIDDAYGAPLRSGHPQRWFDAEQARVHRMVNTVWPRALGTTPAGMARAMTAHSAARGVRYRWRPAGPQTVPVVCDAVTAGWPVAMLLGSALPRHWVLLTEIRGPAMRCYEPSSGALVSVPIDDIRAGRVHGLGFGRPFAFVLPKV